MDAWLTNGAWSRYSASADVIGGFATGLGVLVGGISLLLIWIQTRHSAHVSREVTAFEAHKDYMRLCIDHPRLSSSDLMLRHLKLNEFDGILENEDDPEIERALWFFSYVLFAMEQLLLTNSRWFRIDPAWRSTVEDQLGYHAPLLKEVWSRWQSHYSPTMDKVVKRVLLKHLPEGDSDPAVPAEEI
jgi:hypothetical protein